MTDPIAYTYEADQHCEACAYKRFGRTMGEIVGVDDEGNEVGAWFAEEAIDYPAHCGDCGEFLENRLTDEGVRYLREMLALPGAAIPALLWREFYADDLERAS